MISRSYNYRNLGNPYYYTVINNFNIIDLIEDNCKKKYEISQDFTLKMIGKNSGGGSVFDLKVNSIKLPVDLEEVLSETVVKFLYDYQRITDHIVIELKNTGEIQGIDNVAEINYKWESLKPRLQFLPQKEISELLENGEIAFGENFDYRQTLLKSPLYRFLFPGFHNLFIDSNMGLNKNKITSLIFSELDYVTENYFRAENDLVFIESFLSPEHLPEIQSFLEENNEEVEVQSLFYKAVAEYQLDSGDHIRSAECIQIETLNGSDEVINHFKLSLLS
jgi:hypothetical protein